jgi:hypothetical protein
MTAAALTLVAAGIWAARTDRVWAATMAGLLLFWVGVAALVLDL